MNAKSRVPVSSQWQRPASVSAFLVLGCFALLLTGHVASAGDQYRERRHTKRHHNMSIPQIPISGNSLSASQWQATRPRYRAAVTQTSQLRNGHLPVLAGSYTRLHWLSTRPARTCDARQRPRAACDAGAARPIGEPVSVWSLPLAHTEDQVRTLAIPVFEGVPDVVILDERPAAKSQRSDRFILMFGVGQ